MTVWCGFHAGGVIGPYFFVDENDCHVTVNGERYRAMLEDYLWPEMDEHDINDMWFRQDGATSHATRVTIDLLMGKFGERVISRKGPVVWPPRSCEITPLDYRIGACTRGLASSADLAVCVVQGRNRFIPPLAGVASQSAQRACGRGWKSRANG